MFIFFKIPVTFLGSATNNNCVYVWYYITIFPKKHIIDPRSFDSYNLASNWINILGFVDYFTSINPSTVYNYVIFSFVFYEIIQIFQILLNEHRPLGF